jgi:multiple sugar transport system ATP-binding protein
MRADIAALQADTGITTVYVTHDQSEAMTLGHRVAVLKDGKLQQCDTPKALYASPANVFVAGFIGSPAMNLCPAPNRANGSLSFGGVSFRLPIDADSGRPVVLGLRPESLELASDGVPARVDAVEELGADAYLFCTAELAGESVRLVARVHARQVPDRGERVSLRPRPDEAHLFDAETGERLSS